jgi:hypothetical protein
MAVKRTFRLTDKASVMLDTYCKEHPETTYGDVVSEAIINYVVNEKRDYAEETLRSIVEELLRKEFNRMVSLIVSVGIDVNMVLIDVLEQRARDPENAGLSFGTIYQDVRQEAMKLFRKKKSAQEFLNDGTQQQVAATKQEGE